jgi:hypothetical protein
MQATDTPRYVIATFVKPGRDSDFEQFIRDVVVPAVAQVQPQHVGAWRLLRPAGDETEETTRAWIMTMHGPSSLEDWDLQPLFDAAYGADASREHMRYLEDMLDGDQTVYALSGEVQLSD